MSWDRLKGVELSPGKHRVTLQLFAAAAEETGGFFEPRERTLECGHAAAMHLVYETLQKMRTLYGEALVTYSLAEASGVSAEPSGGDADADTHWAMR